MAKEKIGYALFPAGDTGRKPYSTTAWAIGINANSARKDAAWAFIEWASGRDMVLQAQKIGNPGARSSLWHDEEGISGFPDELIPVINESIPIGMSYDRPKVIHVKEARDIIGGIVVKGLIGEDVGIAAESANVQLQELIDSEVERIALTRGYVFDEAVKNKYVCEAYNIAGCPGYSDYFAVCLLPSGQHQRRPFGCGGGPAEPTDVFHESDGHHD